MLDRILSSDFYLGKIQIKYIYLKNRNKFFGY